ncbi:hypothetical protein EJB05_31395, partial [Eragrostis curvula]
MASLEHVRAALRKRRRERSAERWRELARTVPGTLLRVATSESAFTDVGSTAVKLRGYTVADLLKDRAAAAGDGNGRSRLPPSKLADSSLRELERLAAQHDAAGHVFAHCAAHFGLTMEQGNDDGDGAEARWKAWGEHRAEAARHSAEALRRLRSAMANLDAAARVTCVVSGGLAESPLAWALEAERLLRQAGREATVALKAVPRMQDAVVLEFFDAWMLLSCLEARGGAQAGEQSA